MNILHALLNFPKWCWGWVWRAANYEKQEQRCETLEKSNRAFEERNKQLEEQNKDLKRQLAETTEKLEKLQQEVRVRRSPEQVPLSPCAQALMHLYAEADETSLLCEAVFRALKLNYSRVEIESTIDELREAELIEWREEDYSERYFLTVAGKQVVKKWRRGTDLLST